MTHKSFSITDRLKSFKYAFMGLIHLFKYEHNSWIHLAVMLLVLIIGCIVDLSTTEWIFVVFAFGIVFTAELFNTAIERLTDLNSPDVHPLAKQAKDLAAAAVLIAAITAVVIGLIIFIPKIFG
ncbi:MAG: diacylglycerol kinase family protein [Bacteroidales bacterium]|nr:diacylglycerol kinase family protein [Bacteroidales bacterium]